VAIRCATWEQVEALYTRKILGTGLFVRTTDALPSGTPVPVVVRFPDNQTLRLAGYVAKVINGPKTGMNVRFAELGPELVAAFENAGAPAAKPAAAPPPPPEPAAAPPPPEPETASPAKEPIEFAGEPTHHEPMPPEIAAVPDEFTGEPTALTPIPPEVLATPEATSGIVEEISPGPAQQSAPIEEISATAPVEATYFDRGRQAFKEHRYTEAKDFFGQALELDADATYVRAAYYLALAYEAREGERMRDAQLHFQTATHFDPDCNDKLSR
jgi:tetratricopeptide (TPR) repeat protein